MLFHEESQLSAASVHETVHLFVKQCICLRTLHLESLQPFNVSAAVHCMHINGVQITEKKFPAFYTYSDFRQINFVQKIDLIDRSFDQIQIQIQIQIQSRAERATTTTARGISISLPHLPCEVSVSLLNTLKFSSSTNVGEE